MHYVYQASWGYYVQGNQIRNVNQNGAIVMLNHIYGSGLLPMCHAQYATDSSCTKLHSLNAVGYGVSLEIA